MLASRRFRSRRAAALNALAKMPIPPEISERPLPYAALLDARPARDIDLVVIHCTELPDLATAREFGERVQDTSRGTGFCGHFYVDRDGSICRYVPVERVAHHTRGYNVRSIGIELVNNGRYPDWYDSRRQVLTDSYPLAQIGALLDLLRELEANLPQLRFIAGHEDLDRGTVPASDDPALEVYRKRDPGPMFPWAEVLAASRLERLDPATAS